MTFPWLHFAKDSFGRGLGGEQIRAKRKKKMSAT
jgi:hypothetical protein